LTVSAYHGDVTPEAAFEALKRGRAALVDVRTAAEWTFVGLPDLGGTGAPLVPLEWQSYPSMAVDPRFAETLEATLAKAGLGPDDPVFFICRSGARSAAAAAALARRGHRACFNVAGGFEGVPDAEGHRGTVNGWKAAGLPWRQG